MSVVSCRKFEAEIVISQPDKVHTIVDRKVLNWKDYVKSTNKCRKCGTSNIFYWNKPKEEENDDESNNNNIKKEYNDDDPNRK